MKVFPERVGQALDKGLPRAALVAGPERLLVEEACDALRAAARGEQIAERIRIVADGRFDWNELARATETGSLFASRRLVELRIPTGKPGVEGAKAIRAWLEEPSEDVLLVICDQWELAQERTAWARAVDKAGLYVPCWQVKPDRMPRWIAERLRSRGLSADRQTVDFLAQRLEGNLLAAAQEVDRLALLYRDGRLDAGRLQEAVADSARFDVYRLVELVLTGQAGAALRCIRGLRESDAPRVMVVWALGRELDLVLQVATLSRRMPVSRAMAELKVWQSRQPAVQACLNRLGPARLEQVVIGLAELDLMAKGQGGPRLPGARPGESRGQEIRFWIELERLCMDLARNPGMAA